MLRQQAGYRSVSRDRLESPHSRETRCDSQPSEEDGGGGGGGSPAGAPRLRALILAPAGWSGELQGLLGEQSPQSCAVLRCVWVIFPHPRGEI